MLITRDKPTDIKKIPPKEKKYQKQKIPGTFFTKYVVTKAKSSYLNELIGKLVDDEGTTLLQNVRDYAHYEDYTLAYHYCLSLIFRNFNQAELEVLFLISLLFFYKNLDKEGIKDLNDVFEFTYYQFE